jgi:hypothetical protein
MGQRLNERMERVEHRGRAILYSDYRGLKGDDLVSQIRANCRLAAQLARMGETEQLRLADLRDTFATPEAIDAIKAVAKEMKPFTKAHAVLGVTGVRKYLLRIVHEFSGLSSRPFDTEAEAKEWLAGQ